MTVCSVALAAPRSRGVALVKSILCYFCATSRMLGRHSRHALEPSLMESLWLDWGVEYNSAEQFHIERTRLACMRAYRMRPCWRSLDSRTASLLVGQGRVGAVEFGL